MGLGLKRLGGHAGRRGCCIVRELVSKFHAGTNICFERVQSLFAKADCTVKFEVKARKNRK
ncbi:50S ribosomal protein L27 [Salmonella enterica]|uniref:50S ribosomal protein L27 n=1 Tax=Salmonella enterica TaxID=28901 RepID=UPI00398C69CF